MTNHLYMAAWVQHASLHHIHLPWGLTLWPSWAPGQIQFCVFSLSALASWVWTELAKPPHSRCSLGTPQWPQAMPLSQARGECPVILSQGVSPRSWGTSSSPPCIWGWLWEPERSVWRYRPPSKRGLKSLRLSGELNWIVIVKRFLH